MRSTFLIGLALVPVVILGARPSGAVAQKTRSGVFASRGEELKKAIATYKAANEKVLKRAEEARAVEEIVKPLQQGHKAGEAVFDTAEAMRVHAQTALDEAKTELGIAAKSLETHQTELTDDVVKHEDALKSAQPIRAEFDAFAKADREREAAHGEFDIAKATRDDARREADRLRVHFNNTSDFLAKALAKVALDNADAKVVAAEKEFTAAEARLKDAAKRRDDALETLRQSIEKLKNDLTGLGIAVSQASPATDSGDVRIRLAGFLEHGLRNHGTPEVLESNVLPGPGIVTIPGEVIGESIESLESIESPAIPFVQPLEPPVAPAPPQPTHCLPREIPLGDPAYSWRREAKRTVIELLPRPDDTSPLADSTTSKDSPPAIPQTILTPGIDTRAFVFDCPANFPIMRFKNRFKSYEDEGIRIVEGMVLRLASDGSYEVEFLAEGLSAPVTLRLQFTLQLDGRLGSLTLPPLTLDPRAMNRADDLPNSWRVVNRGSLSFLRGGFSRPAAVVVLSRDGVARFGRGVEPAITNDH
jgi:hypothetical protein